MIVIRVIAIVVEVNERERERERGQGLNIWLLTLIFQLILELVWNTG